MKHYHLLTSWLFSPVFPYLPFLLSLAFILVFKSWDSVLLCDSTPIQELKESIQSEIVKFNVLHDIAEKLDDIADEEYDISDEPWQAARETERVAKNLYQKIRETEYFIKQSEPDYLSGLKIPWDDWKYEGK